MLKKLALTTTLATTAALATWDYYPVLDAGKGSIKAGLYYDRDKPWSQAGLTSGVRFSIMQGLELSIQDWGYRFWSEGDCPNDWCTEGGDGFSDLTIGGRYQVIPMLTAFLDFHLPVGDDDDGINGHPVSTSEYAIYLGVQFSLPSGVKGLEFGAESGLDWGFEHNHYERGLEIHAGAEIKYQPPEAQNINVYGGAQFKLQLTEDSYEDNHGNRWRHNDNGDHQINLWAGMSFIVSPQFLATGRFTLRRGDMDGYAHGLYAGCEFTF